MGNHDTPYKLGTGSLDPFADTIADYNGGNGSRLDAVQLISNAHDARNPNAIAYISPTWSGFHFAAAVVANNNVGANDKTMDALSLTGVYANGPLFASVSYQDLGDAAGTNATNDAWKLGVGYTFGDAKVGFVYEDVDTGAAATDRDSWLINGVYSMGPIALKAMYGQADVGVGAGSDHKLWALGVDYNLSKRTAAYVVYGNGDNDAGPDVSGFNIGIKHSF
jgi:predicted porin